MLLILAKSQVLVRGLPMCALVGQREIMIPEGRIRILLPLPEDSRVLLVVLPVVKRILPLCMGETTDGMRILLVVMNVPISGTIAMGLERNVLTSGMIQGALLRSMNRICS
ncbi:hypothetical protein [Corynebacterium lowii]|uniref:hypothetical protein n=1 Tax=Corynebacterium lowii TaxID=1544413 RepID=UPI0006DD24BD|nr:hypothetical protein [Corynebacterium lowii]MDP9852721.1 hypothetical protein [Corynebacterium lowii]